MHLVKNVDGRKQCDVMVDYYIDYLVHLMMDVSGRLMYCCLDAVEQAAALVVLGMIEDMLD